MRRWLIAALVLAALPSVLRAEISIDDNSITPENRVINKTANKDVIGDSRAVSFVFAADVTGLVELFVVSSNGNRNLRKSVPYGEANVTQTIEITVAEIETASLSGFDMEVRLTHEESSSQATDTTESTANEDAVTEAVMLGGFLVDGERPESIELEADELALSLADGAINVHWNPSASYSLSASEVSNNVAFFRVIWATQPLSNAININGDSLTQRGSFWFAEIADYDTLSFADVDAADENYLIDGLENSVTVYVTVHPVDHAGNAGLISVDSQGRALDVSEAPISTMQLAEILGIDDRCFVVTAAFGDAGAGWVDAYRFFRDGFLLRLPFGETLVATYYRHSPRAAGWLEQSTLFRPMARAFFMIGAPVAILLGGAGPLLLLAGGVWWLQRRRTGLVLLLLVLLPQSGSAIEFIRPGLSMERSAQVQVGQMQPDRVQGVDPASGLLVRYEDVYGSKGAFPLHLAYQITPFQLLGDWGFRGSVGIALDRGKSINTESGVIERTSETSKFLYAPTSVGLAYRGRWFENQPVIIGGNAGIDFWGFREKGGSNSPKTRNYVYGWHAAGELEILMDWMERKAAMQMRENYGIRDTMMFVGWQYTQLDDFGNLNTADFTHHNWIAGFRFVFE